MSFPFDPRQGLIVVWAELSGPDGRVRLRLALDTGASGTMINVGHLVAIGYDPALSPKRIQVTTGSGVEFVPRVQVTRLKSLGQERVALPILSHTLPPSAGIDGLLGLDFRRGHHLEVDFVRGLVSLS